MGEEWGSLHPSWPRVTLFHPGNTVLLFLPWGNSSFTSQSFCLFQGTRLGTTTKIYPFIPSQLESSLPDKVHLNFLHTQISAEKRTPKMPGPPLVCHVQIWMNVLYDHLQHARTHSQAELEMNDAPFPYLSLNFSFTNVRKEWVMLHSMMFLNFPSHVAEILLQHWLYC